MFLSDTCRWPRGSVLCSQPPGRRTESRGPHTCSPCRPSGGRSQHSRHTPRPHSLCRGYPATRESPARHVIDIPTWWPGRHLQDGLPPTFSHSAPGPQTPSTQGLARQPDRLYGLPMYPLKHSHRALSPLRLHSAFGPQASP